MSQFFWPARLQNIEIGWWVFDPTTHCNANWTHSFSLTHTYVPSHLRCKSTTGTSFWGVWRVMIVWKFDAKMVLFTHIFAPKFKHVIWKWVGTSMLMYNITHLHVLYGYICNECKPYESEVPFTYSPNCILHPSPV